MISSVFLILLVLFLIAVVAVPLLGLTFGILGGILGLLGGVLKLVFGLAWKLFFPAVFLYGLYRLFCDLKDRRSSDDDE